MARLKDADVLEALISKEKLTLNDKGELTICR